MFWPKKYNNNNENICFNKYKFLHFVAQTNIQIYAYRRVVEVKPWQKLKAENYIMIKLLSIYQINKLYKLVWLERGAGEFTGTWDFKFMPQGDGWT